MCLSKKCLILIYLFFFQKLGLGWVFRPKPVKTKPKPKVLGLGWVLGRDIKMVWVLGSIFENVWVFGSTSWMEQGEKYSSQPKSLSVERNNFSTCPHQARRKEQNTPVPILTTNGAMKEWSEWPTKANA